ncbi:uncharacterized protein LOC123948079 [Meles meles]|uniref:uncharacterized protein LOC123948079 n=1 Tax=Meles meles TaxID=9662 RepID=UPI001E69E932|nr:uncharacterized protein LOC123948079 [Meles meles]
MQSDKYMKSTRCIHCTVARVADVSARVPVRHSGKVLLQYGLVLGWAFISKLGVLTPASRAGGNVQVHVWMWSGTVPGPRQGFRRRQLPPGSLERRERQRTSSTQQEEWLTVSVGWGHVDREVHPLGLLGNRCRGRAGNPRGLSGRNVGGSRRDQGAVLGCGVSDCPEDRARGPGTRRPGAAVLHWVERSSLSASSPWSLRGRIQEADGTEVHHRVRFFRRLTECPGPRHRVPAPRLPAARRAAGCDLSPHWRPWGEAVAKIWMVSSPGRPCTWRWQTLVPVMVTAGHCGFPLGPVLRAGTLGPPPNRLRTLPRPLGTLGDECRHVRRVWTGRAQSGGSPWVQAWRQPRHTGVRKPGSSRPTADREGPAHVSTLAPCRPSDSGCLPRRRRVRGDFSVDLFPVVLSPILSAPNTVVTSVAKGFVSWRDSHLTQGRAGLESLSSRCI